MNNRGQVMGHGSDLPYIVLLCGVAATLGFGNAVGEANRLGLEGVHWVAYTLVAGMTMTVITVASMFIGMYALDLLITRVSDAVLRGDNE